MRYSVLRPIALILAGSKNYGLQYTGTDYAPSRGPFIIVANHQTGVDPIAVALALHKTLKSTPMIPWGKVEIGRGLEGKLAWFLWHVFRIIPIDRDAEGQEVQAIKMSLNHLRKGKIILVFPEGSRYPHGEVGPLQFGLANLARSAPAPILPVACWRRKDGDNGVQLNIGKPFFMPNIRRPLKVLTDLEEKAEDGFSNRIDLLKQWSEGVTRDRKGMKMIANMISQVVESVERQEFSFDAFCRLAEAEDNRFMQDRVLELLPAGWRAVSEKEGTAETQRITDRRKAAPRVEEAPAEEFPRSGSGPPDVL